MKTFECKALSATITKLTCIARHKALAEAEKIKSKPGIYLKGLVAVNYLKYKDSCGGCDIGLKLYDEHLKTNV